MRTARRGIGGEPAGAPAAKRQRSDAGGGTALAAAAPAPAAPAAPGDEGASGEAPPPQQAAAPVSTAASAAAVGEARFAFRMVASSGASWSAAMRPSQHMRRVRGVAAVKLGLAEGEAARVVMAFAGREVADDDTPAGIGLGEGGAVGVSLR